MWWMLLAVPFVVGAARCAALREEEKKSPLEKCADGYCEVPGGTFQMGSDFGSLEEQPVREITMTGFQLGQTEVSVGDYEDFLKKKNEGLKGIISGLPGSPRNRRGNEFFPHIKISSTYPVVALTFDEKRAYCLAKGGDLPTAAQLHYASRYDEQDSSNGTLIISENGFKNTEPVNRGYKNRFGIYNLLGNVQESSRDSYSPYFYTYMASQDPYSPMTETEQRKYEHEELSGGYFHTMLINGENLHLRRILRTPKLFGLRDDVTGFRCARPLPKTDGKI